MPEAQFWVLIIGAIGVVLTQLYTLYLNYQREMQRQVRERKVARKVETVRRAAVGTEQARAEAAQQTHAKQAESLQVLNTIHTLVNNETRATLQTIVSQADYIAQLLQGKEGHASAVIAAELARSKLQQHDAKQNAPTSAKETSYEQSPASQ